ncbi:MAG TPA: SGNH hydrolase domain-containing protein [Solirubrobacteraceae bacterium]|nr:SGNH hydrolase domain-containing protein [Solirubrobacteraceae bacterium]
MRIRGLSAFYDRRLLRRATLLALLFAAVPVAVADARSAPRCFGAASRDHVRPCHNPRLDRTVTPTPAQAKRQPNAPCAIPRLRYPMVCEFGAPEASASRRIALIGDSHAVHWRAALGPVAQARGWAGFSLSRNGCPLSTATPILRGTLAQQCVRWRGAVRDWLLEHPGVDTLFVSQHRVRVRGSYADELAGYLTAWRAVPETVKRIVVIRDTPIRPPGVRACVSAAIRRRTNAGRDCAVPRGSALLPDPAADAARRAGGRVRLVDMTRYFCSPRLCFPVVGGVLTHKDRGHMTAAFGATLAPMLARRLSPLGLRR